MRCKEIQKLLATDYLDKEINEKALREIELHLENCPACRGLAEELKEQRRLLRETKLEPAPERVWLNIRDTIIAERMEKERARRGILGWLENLIPRRHPVFALATTLTAVIFFLVVAGVFMQKKQAANPKAEEIYGVGPDSGSVIYSLGTAVEDYFL
jgi:predicted anti-sigma-YlaC factor YlaD